MESGMSAPAEVDDSLEQTEKALFADHIELISFGHRYGSPQKNGHFLCLSAQHLTNPSRDSRDKMDGTMTRLQKEVYGQMDFNENYQALWEEIVKALMELPKAETCNLIIAVGCEEGRHRSVAVVELLARDLKNYCDSLQITHRDLDRKSRQINKKKECDRRRQEKRSGWDNEEN